MDQALDEIIAEAERGYDVSKMGPNRVPAHLVVRNTIYYYVLQYMRMNTYSPTFAEIAEAVGVSKGSVFTHLRALRQDGRLNYVDGEPRTITLPPPIAERVYARA